MISVVIRNKNQGKALEFLLRNLNERYSCDIDEIIVLDNISTDNSKLITEKYNAKYIPIKNFSYGGSANLAAESATNDIIVLFSAHSYPVSHDFFKLIREKMDANSNLAGLRCLHNSNDYKNYINKISAKNDPNKSGLIFSGSAFNKKVWEKYPFREDVATFEDKEWSKRVLENGYEIDFVPSIFNYDIKRTPKQIFFRFKNDVIANYQLWHEDITLKNIVNKAIISFWNLLRNFFKEIYYILLRFMFLIYFINNKPKKF